MAEIMKVKDVVNTDVITIERSANLRQILEILSKFHSFAIVPVIDSERNFLGIITLQTILEEFSVLPHRLRKMAHYGFSNGFTISELQSVDIPTDAGTLFLADDLMEKNNLTVSPETPIQEVEKIMELNRIEIIPVVDGKKFIGFVSRFDIFLGILKKKGII